MASPYDKVSRAWRWECLLAGISRILSGKEELKAGLTHGKASLRSEKTVDCIGVQKSLKSPEQCSGRPRTMTRTWEWAPLTSLTTWVPNTHRVIFWKTRSAHQTPNYTRIWTCSARKEHRVLQQPPPMIQLHCKGSFQMRWCKPYDDQCTLPDPMPNTGYYHCCPALSRPEEHVVCTVINGHDCLVLQGVDWSGEWGGDIGDRYVSGCYWC